MVLYLLDKCFTYMFLFFFVSFIALCSTTYIFNYRNLRHYKQRHKLIGYPIAQNTGNAWQTKNDNHCEHRILTHHHNIVSLLRVAALEMTGPPNFKTSIFLIFFPSIFISANILLMSCPKYQNKGHNSVKDKILNVGIVTPTYLSLIVGCQISFLYP